MTQDQFFGKMMKDEFPNAGFIRRWWERKKMNLWLLDKDNADFIKQIPFIEN